MTADSAQTKSKGQDGYCDRWYIYIARVNFVRALRSQY